MSRSTTFVTAILTVSIIAAFVARVPAQQPASLQTELLTEVRLLRQALESLTGTNVRVQIVFGRLQLQEQRTAAAARRLDEVRGELAGLSISAGDMGERVKEFEEMSSDSRRKPEELEAVRHELTMVRRQLAGVDAERARLMNEENEAAGMLNQEQGRSSDLNRQLDELERQLIKPPR